MTCCVCEGTGLLSGWAVFDREPRCTCGTADPADHAADCDTVPCPFDQLMPAEAA